MSPGVLSYTVAVDVGPAKITALVPWTAKKRHTTYGSESVRKFSAHDDFESYTIADLRYQKADSSAHFSPGLFRLGFYGTTRIRESNHSRRLILFSERRSDEGNQ